MSKCPFKPPCYWERSSRCLIDKDYNVVIIIPPDMDTPRKRKWLRDAINEKIARDSANAVPKEKEERNES